MTDIDPQQLAAIEDLATKLYTSGVVIANDPPSSPHVHRSPHVALIIMLPHTSTTQPFQTWPAASTAISSLDSAHFVSRGSHFLVQIRSRSLLTLLVAAIPRLATPSVSHCSIPATSHTRECIDMEGNRAGH